MDYTSGNVITTLQNYSGLDWVSLVADCGTNGATIADAFASRFVMTTDQYNTMNALRSYDKAVTYNHFNYIAGRLTTVGNTDKIHVAADIYNFDGGNPYEWALVVSMKKSASGFYYINVRIKHYTNA